MRPVIARRPATRSTRTACALAAAGLALLWPHGPARSAASVTFSFDVPAVAHPGGPHVPVGWLTLTENAPGTVAFVLTPNWHHLGAGERIDELHLAYRGPAAGLVFQDLGLPPIAGFDPDVANSHAGYKPELRLLTIHWDNSHQGDHFEAPATSAWTFAGATLADFTGTFALAKNWDVARVHAIVSVQGHAGDSQNWVSAVPEPRSYALLPAGLALIGFAVRRRARPG